MVDGWTLVALAIMTVASVARALFALWRFGRWLTTVENLAGMIEPGYRVVCRDVEGGVIEITPGEMVSRGGMNCGFDVRQGPQP